ncbi:hypothetical protein D3C86_1898160 [compost metagenome]
MLAAVVVIDCAVGVQHAFAQQLAQQYPGPWILVEPAFEGRVDLAEDLRDRARLA